MRVLMVMDSMHMGGTELNAIRQSRELLARGVEVVIAANRLEGSLFEEVRSLGVPTSPLPGGAGILGLFRRARALARLASTHRVDVVYSHDLTGNITAALARAWHPRLRTIMSRRFERASLPKLAVLNDLAYRAATTVVVNSETGRSAMIASGIAPARVHVVNNMLTESALVPFDVSDRLAWREALGIFPSAIVVGVVGRLRPVKGHAILLRAWASLALPATEALLVMIGGDFQKEVLEALTDDLGLRDRVLYVGELPNSPHPATLLDLLVLPSLAEGMPNALIEAMAHGVPAIASAVGGVSEIAKRFSLVTVPPSMPEALADALQLVLSTLDERRKIALRQQAKVRLEYSTKRAIETLLPLLTVADVPPIGRSS